MATKHTKLYKFALSMLLGAVVATIAIVVAPAGTTQNVLQFLDPLWWDVIRGSQVSWHGRDISLPKGRYKWTKATDSELIVVRRGPEATFVLTLAAVKSGDLDPIEFSRKLCERQNRCTDIHESSKADRGLRVQWFRYRDSDTKTRNMLLRAIDLGVWIQIEADSEELLAEAVALADSMFLQLNTGRLKS